VRGVTADDARREVCRVGALLYARGLAHGTAGNISVKLDDDSVLITSTDACLGALAPALLAHVSADGRPLGGARASKTLALHRAIHGADAGARCVLHTHSTHLVALTLTGVWSDAAVLPPITPYQVMKVGRVPLVAYCRPGDPAVPDLVAHAITTGRLRGAPIRAVLLERLGPVLWHDTPAAALAALEELEETARLWSMAKPAPLGDAQLDELREAFGARW
jgi:ribulose-5-phosphate 4-epimerase/fuculose-1-phosphate aldolase